MELAIYLSDLSRYQGNNLSKYDCNFANSERNGVRDAYTKLNYNIMGDIKYLYFGCEFCEYLIPNLPSIEKWVDICSFDGLKPVFVTPVVSDYGIPQIRYCLQTIQALIAEASIVVNDYGVLEMIRTEFPRMSVIIGRVLDKMSHDSRAYGNSLTDYYGEDGLRYAATPGNISEYSLKALGSPVIKHFEYDLPNVGIRFDNKKLKYSVYWPFHYLTTGRVCLFRATNKIKEDKFLVGDVKCDGICRDFELELRKPLTGFQTDQNNKINDMYLFQKGNTIFYLYKKDNLNELLTHFDRIVIQIL